MSNSVSRDSPEISAEIACRIFAEITAEGNNTTTHNLDTGPGELTTLFWCMAVFYLCVAVIPIFGNGLVIYVAYGNRNLGPLRYLDDVIKSLAVNDMLFGLLGCPLMVYASFLGR